MPTEDDGAGANVVEGSECQGEGWGAGLGGGGGVLVCRRLRWISRRLGLSMSAALEVPVVTSCRAGEESWSACARGGLSGLCELQGRTFSDGAASPERWHSRRAGRAHMRSASGQLVAYAVRWSKQVEGDAPWRARLPEEHRPSAQAQTLGPVQPRAVRRGFSSRPGARRLPAATSRPRAAGRCAGIAAGLLAVRRPTAAGRPRAAGPRPWPTGHHAARP